MSEWNLRVPHSSVLISALLMASSHRISLPHCPRELVALPTLLRVSILRLRPHRRAQSYKLRPSLCSKPGRRYQCYLPILQMEKLKLQEAQAKAQDQGSHILSTQFSVPLGPSRA